ncbi:MAG: GNAT family N-acetyltransferase, partial [Vogesella sp.]|nr:GNAT family N-acetyltransferase [Vogesella sp.]
MGSLRLIPLTDEAGQIIEPELLQSAAALHRQLRPMLPEEGVAYLVKMQRVCRYGARLVLACNEQGQPLGLALFRLYENTYEDLRLYVDDLVTDETARSQGVGSQL